MQTLAPPLFQQYLQQAGTVLLDVRTPGEVAVATLHGALNIPLHELPSRVGEIGRPVAIAVYCHHGVRSEHASRWLEHQGFTGVAHLEGGIDAWSQQIDPSVPRY